ncbi:MAG: class I SAM-dependent methyltransferase [Pseudomonadota bacterium]
MAVDVAVGRAFVQGDPARLVQVSDTDRHGRLLRTVIDMGTGIVRNDPIPTDEDVAAFYATAYRAEYKASARPRARQVLRNFRRVAAHLRRHAEVILPRQRVIDVGAGSGEFLFMLSALGKDARGIEPNRAYAAHCREALSLDVRTLALAPDLFPPGSADLIRLHHVLEHLNDPVRYLAMIARWLAPGGLMWVDVPDIEAYARTKSRGAMFHYGHVFNFCPETLRMTARLAGLVEHASTAGQGGVGGFFECALEPAAHGQFHAPEVARRLRRAIEDHYAGVAPVRRPVRRPVSRVAGRAEEVLRAALAAGRADWIGRRQAMLLKRDLGL